MKIISTNLGEARTIEWRGQQIQTGIYKYPVEVPIFLGTEDVQNDQVIDRRYHGGADKACYLYPADHYPFWKTRFPDLDWEWGMFGENLTVSGLNEAETRIGDCFRIGGAVVQATQPRQPCFKLGLRFGDQSVVGQFWMLPFPGVYVRVISPGKVQPGDELVLIESNPESLSVAQVFSLFRINPTNFGLIGKAVDEPFLAESCRKDLLKLLK